MIKDKRLEYICSIDGCEYYKFKASLFNYFYKKMAPYEGLFSRKIRETIDYNRGGYCAVYQCVNNAITGYVTIVAGGGRNTFCTKDDIVLCNVWIDPGCRGQGLSNKLIAAVTHNCNLNYKKSYAFIRHNNSASIRCFENNGYKKIANATTKGIFHKVILSKDGRLGIYEYIE